MISENSSSLYFTNFYDAELLDKAIEANQCQCCYELKDVITLKCRNQICKEDLLTWISQDTNGLMILNNWEKINHKDMQAKCPLCKDLIDDAIIELILDPGLFQSLKLASLERENIQNPPKFQCKGCHEEKLEKMFYRDEEVSCIHLCWECMLESIRKNKLECQECHVKYSEPFLANIKSWEWICYYCKSKKNFLKEFGGTF